MVGPHETSAAFVPPGEPPRLRPRRSWYRRLARGVAGLLSLFRSPWLEEIAVGYEKGGLAVFGEPIPWNAEAILVEALVWMRTEEGGKERFSLGDSLLRGVPPTAASRQEPGWTLLSFRLPPRRHCTRAELCWRFHPLRRLRLPHVTSQEFLQRLQLRSPTLMAWFGDQRLACQAAPPGSCDGLLATALLTSPTSLLPLLDLDLRLEVTNQANGLVQTIPLELSGSQLTAQQALVCQALNWAPQGNAGLSVRWMVCDRLLGSSEFRPVAPDRFEESLYVVDAGYLYRRADQSLLLSHYLPQTNPGSLLGGCYYLASRQRGVAGYCPVEVHCRPFNSSSTHIVLRQQALVLDRPSPLLIPPAIMENLDQSVLELFSRGRKLGSLPVFPCPQGTFTTEGGLCNEPQFLWTESAEWELANRLEQLGTISREPPA